MMRADENFRFWSVDQKSCSTDPKKVQGTLIKCMVMKFRFKSFERKILFNRPKNCSRHLRLMHVYVHVMQIHIHFKKEN